VVRGMGSAYIGPDGPVRAARDTVPEGRPYPGSAMLC
jgi:hypothetical protein